MSVTYLTHYEKYSSGKMPRDDSKAESHGSRIQITRYNRESKGNDIPSYLYTVIARHTLIYSSIILTSSILFYLISERFLGFN